MGVKSSVQREREVEIQSLSKFTKSIVKTVGSGPSPRALDLVTPPHNVGQMGQ